jgi:hypothetical protein
MPTKDLSIIAELHNKEHRSRLGGPLSGIGNREMVGTYFQKLHKDSILASGLSIYCKTLITKGLNQQTSAA